MSLGTLSYQVPDNGSLLCSLNGGRALRVPLGTQGPGLCKEAVDLPESILPPENLVPPAITPTTPVLDTVITCSTGTWRYLITSYTYQWRRNGADISGETASTYTWKLADVAAAITCQVTAHGLTNVTAISNGVIQFTQAPAYGAIPTVASSGPWTYTGDTFDTPVPTPDGGGLWIFHFTWRYQGVNKELTVSNFYNTDDTHLLISILEPTAAEVSSALIGYLGYGSVDGAFRFTLTGQYPSDYNTVSGVPSPAPGTLTAPTLTATPGALAGTPTPTVVNAWERCDATGAYSSTIAGATGLTYPLTSADVTWRIRFKQVATNAIGSATTYSTPTAQITITP